MPRLPLTLLCLLVVDYGWAAVCTSSQYCPLGWSVLRREDGSAHTCSGIDPSRSKCPKPYTCVSSKCGIQFCCLNDKMAKRLQKSSEEEDESDEDEPKQQQKKPEL